MKYDLDLIYRYINGEDLGEYTLEELENNKFFMLQVLNITKDKNMYQFCSDELKRDYLFVKTIILNFKSDLEFIDQVASNYLETIDDIEDSIERTELIIIMSNITEGQYNEISLKYHIMSDALFTGKRLAIELTKVKENSDELNNNLGMGFLYIYDTYIDNDTILSFYAKNIIDAIFTEYDINFEELLHSEFQKAEDIDAMGLNNYMTQFISKYDQMLGSYLSQHVELLSDLKERIKKIQENWNNYERMMESNQYHEIIRKVSEYMENVDSILDETTLLYYVARELNVLDKIVFYDQVSDELYSEILANLDNEFLNDAIALNPQERIHYNNVKSVFISEQRKKSLNSEEKEEEEQIKKGKCKIIEFIPRKKDN